MKYRNLSGEHKYGKESGLGSNLYNAGTILSARGVVALTEGEFDAVIVESHTGIPAVGYPGVDNWQDFYKLCFEGIDEIIIITDGDEVGRKAADRISRKLGYHSRVVDLGDQHDATSYYLEYGAESLYYELTE